MKFQPETYWFGLTPPADAEIEGAWGARGILAGRPGVQYVDLVPDRRQVFPMQDAEPPEAFLTWLLDKVSAWLAARCGEYHIDPGGGETYRLDDGPFHAIACANRSHGYLYIGAWMDSPGAQP